MESTPNAAGKFRDRVTSADKDSVGEIPLSIAVVSPDVNHRNAAIGALERFPHVRIREYNAYPSGAQEVAEVLKEDFDVVIVDLDSDVKCALELVEQLCTDRSTNVIVYSAEADSELLLRSMRAGAREFLSLPLTPSAMAEALARVSMRRLEISGERMLKHSLIQGPRGKLLIFMSAKGGTGVTTIACSVAASLAGELAQRTLLIDLNLPLGDAALTLGVHSQYSTINALEQSHRLDGRLLNSLLAQHESGLYVLAGPTEMTPAHLSKDAMLKLLRVARQEFEYVVVDAGSRLEAHEAYNFDETATIYLVTQVGIPELRNSNRLIKQLQVDGGPKLEVVVNRYNAGTEGIEENQVSKALNQLVQWRVPNDYSAVRRMQNLGTTLSQDDSEIARSIRKMSEKICGHSAVPKEGKKKRFLNLF